VIRVLIVEDSPVQRDFLIYLLEQEGDFTVVGTAADGTEVLPKIERLRPDIVLMDCHMPRMHGVEATRLIMQQCPTPIVLASASLLTHEVEFTFDGIKHGALAVVQKPTALGAPSHDELAADLRRTLRLMAEVKVVRRWPKRHAPRPRRECEATTGVLARPEVIAIAGSTGAPGVLAEILAPLDVRRTPPILVVQHLVHGFVEGMAHWLDGSTALAVEIARHDAVAEAGSVYVAPDHSHLAISAAGRIQLASGPPEDGFRPSATHLFRSVARAYGRRSLGILLSGMGRDGAAGLEEMHTAGAATVAQDQASCVVFGMPGEAVRLGAAGHVLSPAAIAQLLSSLAAPATEEPNARGRQLHNV
jgi:two-component system chemotaxis response regulator CheB